MSILSNFPYGDLKKIRSANGVRTKGESTFTVTGLAFKPCAVCAYNSTVKGSPMTVWAADDGNGLNVGKGTYSNQTTDVKLTVIDGGFTLSNLPGYSQGIWQWWAIGCG